jgi:uncharacterized protein (DUF302 family)
MSLNRYSVAAIMLVGGTHVAIAAEDVTTKRSSNPFIVTLERLEASAKARGFTIFARLDHAAAAAAVGQTMPPSTVLVIGNPKVGTERFLRFPTLAIDLPLKVLIWEDQNGAVWVTYNNAGHMLTLSQRHGLPASDAAKEQATRTEAMLATITETAARHY